MWHDVFMPKYDYLPITIGIGSTLYIIISLPVAYPQDILIKATELINLSLCSIKNPVISMSHCHIHIM